AFLTNVCNSFCCSLAALMLLTWSDPGWGLCPFRRLSSVYCSSSLPRISLLSCHFEYRYQPPRPSSASATRLPIRKYKLRLIQSILQLERVLQPGGHAEGKGLGLFIVDDIARGVRLLRVRVKKRAVLQFLHHGISDVLVGFGPARNVLQTYRPRG